MQLYQKYQPTKWSDVAGQEEILKRLAFLRERDGLAGRAYWLSGPSGCGKSTIAKLIAKECAGELGVCDLDATEITPADIRELERMHRLCGPIGDRDGWAVIINEAQGLRKDTVKQLLITLERIPQHVCWAFTAIDTDNNLFGHDVAGHPLLSRCNDLRLAGGDRTFVHYAMRVHEIASKEGLNGRPISEYIDLVKLHRCNLRSILVAVENGCML